MKLPTKRKTDADNRGKPHKENAAGGGDGGDWSGNERSRAKICKKTED